MRRPHPRFDPARNARVTRAGGKLKILASGPKNSYTEAAAWEAFYAHMAQLGNPVEASPLPVITLGQLADKYGDWMKREVEAGRMQPRTLDYYQHHIQKLLDVVGDFVFLDRCSRPWTRNAVRCRMRRLRAKLKLKPDANGENVVAYTFRHTAATRACTSGVPDRVLADLMGHTSTDTTRRYQHPQLDHLSEAIQKMNGRKAQ